MPVTKSNYFSANNNLKYCGSSQFKDFHKCPAKAMAMLSGEWTIEDSTALLIGSYVDSWFEGTLDQFKAEHPTIFKKDGTLKSEFEKANSVIERVSKDDLFMKYMAGKKQVIKTGTIEGVPFKIKIDSYHRYSELGNQHGSCQKSTITTDAHEHVSVFLRSLPRFDIVQCDARLFEF